MTPVVRLYGKPGCHLCEQAEAVLERLQRRYPHSLRLIDITSDSDLLRLYGERIPVVVIGEQEYAAPLEAAHLENALAAAARDATTFSAVPAPTNAPAPPAAASAPMPPTHNENAPDAHAS
jgi:hypothetical protein